MPHVQLQSIQIEIEWTLSWERNQLIATSSPADNCKQRRKGYRHGLSAAIIQYECHLEINAALACASLGLWTGLVHRARPAARANGNILCLTPRRKEGQLAGRGWTRGKAERRGGK